MRSRETIEHEGTRKDILLLEVLLDIRDMLKPQASRTQEHKCPECGKRLQGPQGLGAHRRVHRVKDGRSVTHG